jgi:transketolase
MFLFEPRKLRKSVLEMAYAGSTVHIGCAFSIIEILAVLYRSHLNLGGGQPEAPGRDYLILSKGHGIMAQYACMKELGWLSDNDLKNYCGDGTLLKGLADAHVPGLEVTSGSLGHGLSVGVGMALGAKRQDTGQRCFAVVGDGEINEGSIWEAAMFASQFKLDNLLVIVDANGYQAMGKTSEIMKLENISERFSVFGFEALDVDGHSECDLDATITKIQNSSPDKPKAIVAHTVKGKGVSFMEQDNRWHYTRLTSDSYTMAINELDT